MLTDTELAEYAELGAAYRNDDNIGLAVGALLLPVAFGSVAVVWQLPQLFLPLFLTSYLAFGFYVLYSRRLRSYTEIRLARMRVLEARGPMFNHRAIDTAVQSGAINDPKVRHLQIASGCSLLLAWAITTLFVVTDQLPLK